LLDKRRSGFSLYGRGEGNSNPWGVFVTLQRESILTMLSLSVKRNFGYAESFFYEFRFTAPTAVGIMDSPGPEDRATWRGPERRAWALAAQSEGG